MPALRASSQHNEWHLQGLFRRAGTTFCHTFGTCVPWQGPGGDRAQNDRSGREELGRAGPIKGKIILKKLLKNPPTAAPAHPFASQPRSVPGAVFPRGPWAALTLSAAQRGHSRAGKGNPRAATSQELCVARETARLVMEASFWGYFLLLIALCPHSLR